MFRLDPGEAGEVLFAVAIEEAARSMPVGMYGGGGRQRRERDADEGAFHREPAGEASYSSACPPRPSGTIRPSACGPSPSPAPRRQITPFGPLAPHRTSR